MMLERELDRAERAASKRTPMGTKTAVDEKGGQIVSIFDGLAREQLEEMLAAGDEINECYRVLRKTDANVVGEVLKGYDTFYEWDHYPDGDVYDDETHSQYYYHAHRGEAGEHGHFHTFQRADGMPKDVAPVPYDGEEEWPSGEDALSHLIAVAMDKHGYPTHLFTTNRWVTGETFYAAEDVVRMLPRFNIDVTFPSWPTNRWLTAMVRLFRPQIGLLLRQRDDAVRDWQDKHADVDVYEDRDLDITSVSPVSVTQQIKQIHKELRKR